MLEWGCRISDGQAGIKAAFFHPYIALAMVQWGRPGPLPDSPGIQHRIREVRLVHSDHPTACAESRLCGGQQGFETDAHGWKAYQLTLSFKCPEHLSQGWGGSPKHLGNMLLRCVSPCSFR